MARPPVPSKSTCSTCATASCTACAPCVIGRQPFGHITIANYDSGAKAYTDAAIDQAWRAVGEMKAV